MSLLRVLACHCSLVCLLAGCSGGSDGPPTYSVSGKVTFDGNPIPQGEIIFRPSDPTLTPAAGTIKDGSYRIKTLKGPHSVSITATREVPGKFDTSNPGESVPVIEQYIPADYNSRTTLSAQVDPAANLEFNFETKSAP